MECGSPIRQGIAVVGGGAKGVAIAAKAKVLAELGCTYSPSVDVFEHSEIGSMWEPGGGYSDGDQYVCTSPHRDLGFPYEMLVCDGYESETDMLHLPPEAIEAIARNASQDGEVYPGVAEAMLGKYSIQRFLLERPRDTLNIQRWVRSGTRRLTHAEFAAYLRWAFSRASAQVYLPDGDSHPPVVRRIAQEVIEVQYLEAKKKWSVVCADALREYDGVVITGNGEPNDKYAATPQDERTDRTYRRPIWNSKTFWNEEPEVRSLVKEKAKLLGRDTPPSPDQVPVAVVGGGGAAAAIAARVATYDADVQVCIFGKTPALYGRHPNSFEEEFYGNNSIWRELTDAARRDYIQRLGGAVVWSYVTDDLAKVTNVSYRCLKLLGVKVTDDASYPLVASFCAPDIEHPAPDQIKTIRCALVIDATGLKGSERIEKLCPGQLGREVAEEFERAKKGAAAFEKVIKPSFEFSRIPDGLHIPDLCAGAGPAAPNLMALGWLATQIFWRYMKSAV